MIVSGQVRGVDTCDIDVSNSDSAKISAIDDSFVAIAGIGSDSPDDQRSSRFLVCAVSPSGRIVVSELFRPPIDGVRVQRA